MKTANATRLIFWVTVMFAVGLWVRAESGEKRTSTMSAKSAPLRIVDQNGQPAVSGIPSPTGVSGGCTPSGWSAGPDMPTPLVRAVGVYFQSDGNFYTMGGRTSDLAGSDFQHVLRYSPASNSWTQMGVTLPDNFVNNMACGVLAVSGTPQIYCVGGSFATGTTATPPRILLQPGDRYLDHLDRRRLAGCHGNNSTRWVCGG
jgi:hypothetical protein